LLWLYDILLATSRLALPLMAWRHEKLRASVVTRPIGERGESVAVRVTFQRIVWDNQGRITIMEGLDEPEYYQEFFAKLSKAVFLEAHEI